MTHPYVCVFTEGEAFRFSRVGGGEGAVPELPPPVPPLAGRAALSWKELQGPERLRGYLLLVFIASTCRDGKLCHCIHGGGVRAHVAALRLEQWRKESVRWSETLVGACDEERDPVVGTGWLRRHFLGRPW